MTKTTKSQATITEKQMLKIAREERDLSLDELKRWYLTTRFGCYYYADPAEDKFAVACANALTDVLMAKAKATTPKQMVEMVKAKRTKGKR